MEAFGRLMMGIAPWLSLPNDRSLESIQREELLIMALKSYENAVDSLNPDYLLWKGESQILVDAAFIASSFLRGFDYLWEPLPDKTKKEYIKHFIELRKIKPGKNNWLLFASTIESFLMKVGEDPDNGRLYDNLKTINDMYIGDGLYSDGAKFHFDYYNIFVIHPMYVECLDVCSLNEDYKIAIKRMQRYGELIERFISPNGHLPIFGRSIVYRTAILQPLAYLSYKNLLPESLSYGQIRSSMTAVINGIFSSKDNFNEKGFLKIGFCGSQRDVGEYYINTGSCYLASTAFLPLGLGEDHPFWSDKSEYWTQLKAYNGDSFPIDKAFDSENQLILKL
ncbi:MAG: DUF2264 domain-containing protein [Methanobrevibacter sp.]|jgi:hypothetical protein|nr:DUF2264 domain-containing protein [Candidatus Methanoflexus mossambicus]